MNASLHSQQGETMDLSQQVGEEAPQAAPTRYWIDLAWYKQRGRSFAALLETRRCYNCLDEIAETRARFRLDDAGAQLVRTDVDATWARIRQCCANSHEFLSPRLPLLEAVFRLFLANGNTPLSIEAITERLTQRHSDYDVPRAVSVEALRRVIEADDYYGVRPHPEAPAETAGARADAR